MEKNKVKNRKDAVLQIEAVKARMSTHDMPEYFKKTDARVTRGELWQILNQVLGNIDTQLEKSFNHTIATSNLVDVVVQALVEKGLITDEDIAKAKGTVIAELEKQLKEGKEDEEGN